MAFSSGSVYGEKGNKEILMMPRDFIISMSA